MRIYVSCLAAYNNGKLHGAWIEIEDCNFDPDVVQERINGMLASSPEPNAEEWAVHDYEGLDGFGEHPNLEHLCLIAELIDKNGEAFEAWVNNLGVDTFSSKKEWEEDFCQAYDGTFRNEEEWAEDCLDGQGLFSGVDDILKNYFNFEAYARDCRMGGDMCFLELPSGGIAAFRNN